MIDILFYARLVRAYFLVPMHTHTKPVLSCSGPVLLEQEAAFLKRGFIRSALSFSGGILLTLINSKNSVPRCAPVLVSIAHPD